MQLAAGTSDNSGVKCIFETGSLVAVRQPKVATHLYRIAQEAVREAVGRGKADRIVITLASNRRSIILTVSDNGVSRPADRRSHHGMVLRMMQHRARVIGAKLQLRDGDGGRGGARVVCELPISSETRLK